MLRTVDRVPTKALDNGAIRYGVYDDKGALIRYEYIKREDEPSVQGDAINRALFEDFLDVGTIIQTDADLSNDDRFLPCNGIFLQQDEYPELYAKIGGKYEEAFDVYNLVGENRDYEFSKGDFDRGIISLSQLNFGGFYHYKDFSEEDVFIFEKSSNSDLSYFIYEIVNYKEKSYGKALDDVKTTDVIRFKNLIIIANSQGIYTTDETASSGVYTWTSRLSTSAYALAHNKNVAVAVCTDGTSSFIYSSTNGTTWTKRFTGDFKITSASYGDAKYKNGVFLVRMGTNLYRSTDGTTWESVKPDGMSLSSSNELYKTNKYFVVSQTSNIYYSEDGITWSTKDVVIQNQVLGQIVSNGKFYDIDDGFRIPFAKGRWIKVK